MSAAETPTSVTIATHSPATTSTRTTDAGPPLDMNSAAVVVRTRARAMTPDLFPVTSAAPSEGGRRFRIRKAQDLQLNVCVCGVTIADSEIQEGQKVMKCSTLGCETVWVSATLTWILFRVFDINITLQFHKECMNYVLRYLLIFLSISSCPHHMT
jgi:hypothetical protein